MSFREQAMMMDFMESAALEILGEKPRILGYGSSVLRASDSDEIFCMIGDDRVSIRPEINDRGAMAKQWLDAFRELRKLRRIDEEVRRGEEAVEESGGS